MTTTKNPILFDRVFKHIKKISPAVRVLNRATDIADLVISREAKYSKLSDLELKNISYRIMDEVANGTSLDNFLVDGLAISREMIYRVHKERAYKVQLIGAIVAHFGDFAEMKTGEGKTLTLLLVSYVNALAHKGVHIVTVNEYLVKRDMEYCQAALSNLGITVGYVTSDMTIEQKQKMYACDITYVANSEVGFDYLRDNMISDVSQKMQRTLNFAIVDEADSILIDEARTPLIIAGNPDDNLSMYLEADSFAKSLTPDDYVIDLETHAINLNDNGIQKAEKVFNISNLYDIENSDIVHKVINALRANYIMELGKEYIIRYNAKKRGQEVALVDSFTGRIMEGRMYSAGLHQAIQAKENVQVDPENITLATITYQSFFRLYKKLAGLSGTALTEKQEFLDIYNMVVVPVPTNKPSVRNDRPDYVFGSKQLKWKYVVADIKRRHEKGQPILVGTVSVEDSELLHQLLNHVGIKHNVLNAKNNAIEAEIIKQAGFKNAVTIATNMAGRGTDIKLGPGVKELGGLFVLGTERNESRRIDNQLRGRSGRQGDPGESRFFISLQDSLFKRFAGDRFDKAQFKMGEDVIDLRFFSRLLDNTQKKVENTNYDVRKNLIDYDYVLSEQRELIYKQRFAILTSDNVLAIVKKMIPRVIDVLVLLNRDEENIHMVHVDNLLIDINKKLGVELDLQAKDFKDLTNIDIYQIIVKKIDELAETKYMHNDSAVNNAKWRRIIISHLDMNWTKFLDKIQKLRDGVALRSYEQKSPLNIYVEDSDRLFYNMTISVAEESISSIMRLKDDEFASSAFAQELSFLDNIHPGAKVTPTTISAKASTDDLVPSAQLQKTSHEQKKPTFDLMVNNVNDVVNQLYGLKVPPQKSQTKAIPPDRINFQNVANNQASIKASKQEFVKFGDQIELEKKTTAPIAVPTTGSKSSSVSTVVDEIIEQMQLNKNKKSETLHPQEATFSEDDKFHTQMLEEIEKIEIGEGDYSAIASAIKESSKPKMTKTKTVKKSKDKVSK